MIQRKTASGIVMLSVLVAISFWAGRRSADRGVQPIAGLDTRLDYALRDFEIQFYDAEGRPAAQLRAPRLTNVAETGVAEVTLPVFDIAHRERDWHIVAESAQVSPDREEVVLRGDVQMNAAAGRHAGPVRISTSELLLLVSPRVASSAERVHIAEGDDTMEAVGFTVDMAENRFQLLNRVRLTYATSP